MPKADFTTKQSSEPRNFAPKRPPGPWEYTPLDVWTPPTPDPPPDVTLWDGFMAVCALCATILVPIMYVTTIVCGVQIGESLIGLVASGVFMLFLVGIQFKTPTGPMR